MLIRIVHGHKQHSPMNGSIKGRKFISKTLPNLPFCTVICYSVIYNFNYLHLFIEIDLTKLHSFLLITVNKPNIQPYIEKGFATESILQKYLKLEILETFYRHESFTDLQNYFSEKICEESGLLFNSDEFTNLKSFVKITFKTGLTLGLEKIVILDNLLQCSYRVKLGQVLRKYSTRSE